MGMSSELLEPQDWMVSPGAQSWAPPPGVWRVSRNLQRRWRRSSHDTGRWGCGCLLPEQGQSPVTLQQICVRELGGEGF